MKLIDSDVLIDILRRHPPAVQWLASLGTERILLPGFVAMEMIKGAPNASEMNTIQRELAVYDRVWPAASACEAAIATLARLHLSHGTGIVDALIAQTAVAQGLPLHTFNVKHFQHVPALTIVQPYTR
jgi:predicted nucleic acid-binding protein